MLKLAKMQTLIRNSGRAVAFGIGAKENPLWKVPQRAVRREGFYEEL